MIVKMSIAPLMDTGQLFQLFMKRLTVNLLENTQKFVPYSGESATKGLPNLDTHTFEM